MKELNQAAPIYYRGEIVKNIKWETLTNGSLLIKVKFKYFHVSLSSLRN